MVDVAPPGSVTVMLVTPAGWAGVLAVMVVPDTDATDALTPPKFSVAPAWKPAPATVTVCPPASVPAFGVTEVTFGGEAGSTVSERLRSEDTTTPRLQTGLRPVAAWGVKRMS